MRQIPGPIVGRSVDWIIQICPPLKSGRPRVAALQHRVRWQIVQVLSEYSYTPINKATLTVPKQHAQRSKDTLGAWEEDPEVLLLRP